MRILAIGLAMAVAIPVVATVPASSGDRDVAETNARATIQAAQEAGSRKTRARVKRAGKTPRGNVGDSQYMNLRMQDHMGQHSKMRTIQSGVAKKQDETQKGMVKKMK